MVWFNTTIKLCDFLKLSLRSPFFEAIILEMKKKTNLQFKCPLIANHYYFHKFQVNTKNLLLNLLYRPNGKFKVFNRIFKNLSNNKVLENYNYTVNYTIAKIC